jgi:phage-related tail fiber protein
MPLFRGQAIVSQQSDYKDSVRVASRSPIDLSAQVLSIDGVTLSSLDRVLLAGQTLASQNGIYIWSATAKKLTRALDADSNFEVRPGMRVYVEEGTNYGRSEFILTTTGTISLGTTSLIFSKVNVVLPIGSGGTYGSATQTLQIVVDESGQIDGVVVFDINLDGGSY